MLYSVQGLAGSEKRKDLLCSNCGSNKGGNKKCFNAIKQKYKCFIYVMLKYRINTTK